MVIFKAHSLCQYLAIYSDQMVIFKAHSLCQSILDHIIFLIKCLYLRPIHCFNIWPYISFNWLYLTFYLSGLSEKWPFFHPERNGQIQNAHISTILVWQICNLAKVFPGQFSFRKCHLNPNSGNHGNAGAEQNGEKTAFLAFFQPQISFQTLETPWNIYLT